MNKKSVCIYLIVFIYITFFPLYPFSYLICEEIIPDAQANCIPIAGTWEGFIHLENEGNQAVVAEIYQINCNIRIVTNSRFFYAHHFLGYIDHKYITVLDRATGQTWTTYQKFATTEQIELFDYVNNFTALDELNLSQMHPPDDQVLPGDINNSGAANLTDVSIGLQILSNHSLNTQIHTMSDINLDGKIGMEDVILILRSLSSK